MAVINVQNWNVEQVIDWITGLDPSLSQYAENFTSHGITGQKLLNLMPGDLDYVLKVGKIGDQLLLHEAIQTLRDELHTPWTTLQTLSLALSVRCKNYRSELTQQKQRYLDLQAKEAELNYPHHHSSSYQNSSSKSNVAKASALLGSSDRGSSDRDRGASNLPQTQGSGGPRLETIPTTSLASASYLLDAGKVLIRWLTRFPFLGKLNYDEISRKLTKHCFELAVLSQRDTFADNAIEEVQYLCTKIIELCEALIHSNDSLAIQPAGIDIITLRKRTEQDWGLQFESSYWGLHQITGVKLSSPAQQSGHLERGDEILQVNYQTVLAWPQTSVISLLHENENEVILTVKRRPRHASTNLLLLGGHQNNMYLNKVPNRKSFFERKEKERARNVVCRNEPRVLLDEIVIEEDENKEDKVNTPEKPPPEVVQPEDEKITASDVRFWKLYPKPKYLIKRRATVTGASPTDTRPPVTFINESDSPPSSGSAPFPNHRSDPSGSDSPAPSKHQPVHHRRSTPVSTITNHESPVHNLQLLHPPLVPRPPLDKSRSAPDSTTVDDQPETQPQSKQPPQESPKQEAPEDDEVFITKEPPTPKPRLSRTTPQITPKDLPPELTNPKILHRGILHIRSQLRKQSSSNSASALPVLGPNSSLSSSTSSLLCSSSPRWIRQNAVFYSNRELEINPISNTRSVSVSNSSMLGCFRVKIALKNSLNGVKKQEFVVQGASEVHSRPFAFKITSGDSVTYYLAAESQIELDQWISVMTTGELINPPDGRLRCHRNVSTSGDSARRSFARAPYKRSISLPQSEQPTVQYPHVSTPPHSSTPPPNSTQQKTVAPRFYASSTNLSTTSLPTSTPQKHRHQPSTYESPTRTLLNRSKSSSLKTDWFLRNTTPQSNISSITITSKKTTRSQASTQVPTPNQTPTHKTPQPVCGVTMKTKKNSNSSSGSCNTSPTRKYMCPNCCNVMKVDMGTQTDEHEQDVKLTVFFDVGSGESRV